MTETPQRPRTLPLMARLLRHRTPLFLLTAFLWFLNHLSPVLYGVLDRGLFDALSGAATEPVSPYTYLALLGVLNLARLGNMAAAFISFSRYFLEVQLLLRRNLLSWLLTAPRSRRLPESPGGAVTRFRDDVEDISRYVDSFVDVAGFAAFALVALFIMVRIDPWMTVMVLLPMGVAIVFTRLIQGPIRNARRRLREAGTQVTDFIGEMMGSFQAIRVAGRTDSVMRHFLSLGEERRRAALRDSLLTESFRSVSDNMVSVATGIMLLAASGRMQDARFTVGDFALFMAYLPYLTGIMTFFGNMLVEHRRAGVSFERLGRLMVDAPQDQLVRSHDLQLRGPEPVLNLDAPERRPLQRLEVRGLSYCFPDGQAGLTDISFSLERGSMTVITGRVGNGKSTLLRVLLGLLPRDSGELLWNGEPVSDPAVFLVPPHAAWTAQVPRLVSDTLRENLLLGRQVTAAELDAALDLAVLRPDLKRLEHGLDTQVGSRGVRLSGGQVQRSAAARMFLTRAELLVFDDLSSALDVETERKLWERVAAAGATCLVVSHRLAALERADQILVMEGGRLTASGTMAELLESDPGFRTMFSPEAGQE